MRVSFVSSILFGISLAACSIPAADDGATGDTGTTGDSGDGDGDGEPDLPGSASYQLFLAGPVDGNLVGLGMGGDGASSANAICAAEGAASWSALECETFSAILNSESGLIANAALILGLDPESELFVATTGLSVGTVGDVFSGVMTTSLVDAGAFADDAESGLWTGSDSEGKYSLACSDWSTAELSAQGMVGDGTVADGWWSGGSVTCSAQRRIVCVCH